VSPWRESDAPRGDGSPASARSMPAAGGSIFIFRTSGRVGPQAVELWLRSADRLAGAHPLSVGDLGCGNERVRDLLASRLGDDFTYQGYDLQP
jgi:hypothetical protein